MASKARHTRTSGNHKMVFSKPASHPSRQPDPRRKFNPVPEMSPEARRAVLLAREDSKMNNANLQNRNASCKAIEHVDKETITKIDTNNNDTAHLLRENREIRGRERIAHTTSRTAQRSSNQNARTTSSRPPRAPPTGTSRSRSSISQNEPPFSMSDHNEIASHFGTNTNSNASVYTSNLSSGNNNNCNYTNTNATPGNYLPGNQNDDDADDDNDSALPNDDSFDDEEEATYQKNSFVLALDKALEKNDISRLKGDITDTTRVTKPGTVRALNGGRLNNAQEVVVNVCHDDDRELVFHDDDEESIEMVKAISQIRVNIWMEYNSKFPPENDLNDFDTDHCEKRREAKENSRHQRQPSAQENKARERTATNQRSHAGPSKDVATRSKLSVDTAGSKYTSSGQPSTANAKRTASSSRLGNVAASPTPSRNSSGTSSRGKVNSIHPTSGKPLTPLRTRR